MSDLRETIARAMFKADWPKDNWDRLGPGHAQSRYLRMADAILPLIGKGQEETGVPGCAGRAGGADAPEPSGLGLRRSSLTQAARMQFNINYEVWVRLTDKGREILRQQHEDLYNFLVERGVKRPEYSPIPEDEAGWSRWQLWALIQTFGPHIGMGRDVPFETTIEIPTPRVSDESRNGQDPKGLEGEAPPARPDEGGRRPLPPPPSLTQGDDA